MELWQDSRLLKAHASLVSSLSPLVRPCADGLTLPYIEFPTNKAVQPRLQPNEGLSYDMAIITV